MHGDLVVAALGVAVAVAFYILGRHLTQGDWDDD